MKKIGVYGILLGMLLIGIGFSYSRAYMKKSVEVANTNLKVGTLEYTTTINNQTTNTVTVPAHEYEFLDVVITSKNSIDSKYSLVYKVTSPTNVAESNYEIAYLESKDTSFGTITANGTKNIRIRIQNNSTSDMTIAFQTKSGLVNNDIELSNEEKEITKIVSTNSLNGAEPVLSDNLVPVKIAADGTVTKADTTKEWYNYENQEWANAVVLVNKSVAYNEGASIPEDNIESYFVWIPRYRYKIFDEGNYSGTTSLDANAPQTIEIEFENKDTPASTGTKVGEWLTHPAFQAFNSNGFWVGKFESGYRGATTTAGAQQNNSNSINLIIKPNAYSWRSITLGNMFKVSYDYLRNDESHTMKNTEWGAVSYLSHSKYGKQNEEGKNTEVYINNNSSYLTGCGGDSASEGKNATCKNAYGSKTDNIYNQSTTGNITGVYDMSGGASEYVMGYNTKATTVGGSSEITSLYSDFFTNEEWNKYYDLYQSSSNSSYSSRILGDATGEMGPFAYASGYRSSWYNNYAYFVYSTNPWFMRGGTYNNTTAAGIFSFYFTAGTNIVGISFRVVLTP